MIKEMKHKNIVFFTIFFVLYVLMILVPNLNYFIFFFRPEAILVALTLLFGWPAIIAVTLASFIDVAIYIKKLGFMILLPFTILAATSLAYKFVIKSKLRYKFLIGTWIITLIITSIMGTYSYFNPPHNEIYRNIEPWYNVFLQSFLSVNILGYLLIKYINKKLGNKK